MTWSGCRSQKRPELTEIKAHLQAETDQILFLFFIHPRAKHCCNSFQHFKTTSFGGSGEWKLSSEQMHFQKYSKTFTYCCTHWGAKRQVMLNQTHRDQLKSHGAKPVLPVSCIQTSVDTLGLFNKQGIGMFHRIEAKALTQVPSHIL